MNRMLIGFARGRVGAAWAGLVAGGILAFTAAAGAATLDDVKARGYVRCGTAPNNPGFAYTDTDGKRKGFDIDFCRAIGAAIFGDASKIKLTGVNGREAFPALQTNQLDVLTHRLTWTYSRDAGTGLDYTVALIYDGQGFMVRKDLGVKSATELSGASVCTAQGTTTELNVADFFRTRNMPYRLVSFGSHDEATQAYDAGRCDVYSNDRNSLAARRLTLRDPSAHIILPETISKEPIGPLVRQGDSQWTDIVRWTMFALIDAEELGVTQANVEDMRAHSKSPAIQRLLGTTGDFGNKLNLDKNWAFWAIKAVGNYGEIFERHLGPKTRIGLERGLNNLWTHGGLMISPPFR